MLEETVVKLVEKHNTANPFTIAEKENISYYYEELPTKCLGLAITSTFDRPVILLHNSLRHSNKRFVVMAHELKHAISHFDLPDFYASAFNGKGKLEHEADLFATHLLIRYYEEVYHRPCESFDRLMQEFDIKNNLRTFFE